MHFGEHLMVDGYGGNISKLDNKEIVLRTVDELVQILEMNKLSEIQVLSAPDNGIKDPGGWSAFVVIAESHISIHTFPKRGFISADVYTCKNGLDQNKVIEHLVSKFDLKETEVNFAKRGTKYPRQNLA